MIKKALLLSFLLLSIVGITGCNNIKNQSNDRNENVSQIEIINDYINIRKEKSIDSDVIGKVYKGEIYTIISLDDSANKWIEIETSNKIHGYIAGIDNYVKYLEYLDEKNNKYKSKYQKNEWECDVKLTEIKTIKDNGMMDIQPKMFISKDGDLYQFSLDKKYSNEQNCKKYDSDKKYDRFYIFPNDRDLSLFVTNNGEFKYLDNDKNIVDFYSIYEKSYSSYISKLYNDNPNSYVKYVMGEDSYYNVYNVRDNKIYLKKISNLGVYINESVFAEFPVDENFISLEGRIFKTNKAFYKVGITNQKNCSEYEDIECIEGLVKLEDVSNHYNDIEYFNGNYIIFKNDNNIYRYSLY